MERKPIEQRLTALFQEHEAWRPQLRDLATYIRPTRGFFDGQPNDGRAPDYKILIDGTSMRSARILASGMTSGLTSPSRPWFKLGLADSDLMKFDPVKVWLSAVQDRMLAVFSKSNIYGVLYSIYEEVGVFGTAASIILADFKDVIRGRSFTAGEYVIGCDANGRTNSFGRKYYQTVAQLVEAFGIQNVSDQVRVAYDNNERGKWVKCCLLIEPNDERDASKADSRNMAYRSVYWEEGSPSDTFLKVSGYEDFPVLAPRWDVTTSADSYGKSPGWDALGDIKMLQKMQKDKLIALDKVVDPPMLQDGSVQGEMNTLPGGISYTGGAVNNAGVRPAYQINPDLNALEVAIEKTQSAISKTFYADLFMMLAQSDRRQITAREVVERHEEKLLMLGPVLERLESELLDPLIDRTFNIMLRSGLIPMPPKELQGQELKPEYISMLAQAQKMVGTTAVEQLASFTGNLAAVAPQVLDVIDFDEAVIEYGEMLGVPAKIVRSKEAVAQVRADKQKQQQAQQMMANMGAMAQGAKVLSDTQVGQNSALDALLGTTGASQ